MIDNFDNYELWKECILLGSFDFEGFVLVNLFDVIIEEVVFNLKVDLLKKDVLYMLEMVECIWFNFCLMFNFNGLKLGFIVFDVEWNMMKFLGYGFWNSILFFDKGLKK